MAKNTDKSLLQPIIDAFVALSVTDKFLQNAIIANILKECGGVPQEENLNYSKTSNDRIRKIFGTRVTIYNEEQLNDLKATAIKFTEVVYGHKTKIGISMGNISPGDGWKYRGRGYIQITGKNNYKYIGDKIGINLIEFPDLLVTDTHISAIAAITFVTDALTNTSFSDQLTANKDVTQVIGGRGLSLTAGYGKELLEKVNKLSSSIIVI